MVAMHFCCLSSLPPKKTSTPLSSHPKILPWTTTCTCPHDLLPPLHFFSHQNRLRFTQFLTSTPLFPLTNTDPMHEPLSLSPSMLGWFCLEPSFQYLFVMSFFFFASRRVAQNKLLHLALLRCRVPTRCCSRNAVG